MVMMNQILQSREKRPGDNFGFVIERRGSDDLFVGAPGALK